MNKFIPIPGFKGGYANALFDPISKQTFQSARDLDVFSDVNLLSPHSLKFQSVTLPTITGGSSIRIYNSFVASDGKTYFIGDAVITSTLNVVLWSTPTIEASPTYTVEYNINTGSPGTPLEEYKDGLFFSWGTNLDRWGNLSGSPARTNITGSLGSVATYIRAHPGLGKIFFVHGKKIGSYDNSTVTLAALTVDNGETIVGIEPLGRFVIVGIRGAGSKRSRFLIWDGSSTTVDDIINLEETGLQGFKIVNNEIRYLTMTYATGSNDFIRLSTVVLGGRPQLIEERLYSVTSGSGVIIANALSSSGNLFFYGFNGDTYSIDLGIFAFGSSNNKIDKFNYLWRLVSTGATTGVSIVSINHTGSNLIVIWSTQSGAGTYYINSFTSGVTANGVYESNAFALNSGLPAKIKRIIINHKPIPTSCGFTVQIKHYGHYTWGTSVPAEDSYADLLTPEGSGSSTGKTQSTNNATTTEITGNELFKTARYAQIKIKFDEVSGTTAPSLIFPILIEVGE